VLTITSPNKGGTRGKILWIIVHTAEGSTNVRSLGNYFAKASVQASSHVGIDDTEMAQYVPYTEQAWTARSANPYADQAELCGFAKWTRADWLSHPGMLELTAQWIAERCKARGIPPVKLSAADVAARKPGVIGHVEITNGLKDGTHTDPGPSFPWDVVMARVNAILKPTPVEDDMPPYISWPAADKAQLIADIWASPGDSRAGTTWIADRIIGTDQKTGDLIAKIDALTAQVAKLIAKLGA
jgi:hypothetical protein